ncbi:hypothetical protein J3E64_002180 [Sphingobium sp. OAS761]|uniref:hypothetical protein n=1 Tax=Sphingobium sp. OAS761 TaxID=2817901 RepID=UPI0020A1D7DD|nr:hypothetical protein [Sphingobium sp. OAS761]MCP1470492.1 hypothetical protein [Sphingobium sp. OAS761]
MAEPKPIASLTSGLLARKGAAQPAMRRPMMGFGRANAAAVQQDDLGWNDMGFDVEPTPSPVEQPPVIGLTPMGQTPVPAETAVPPVIAEREELAERISAPVAEAAPQPSVVSAVPRKAALARTSKAAFTLRLDTERHLKLRLASAVTGRSAQQIVTEALDDLLNNLPEIDRLTDQLPHLRGKN